VKAPSYEKYKDSGIEWLGQIPAHWETRRIKDVTDKIGSGKTPRGGAESYVDEGVMLIRSQNVLVGKLSLDDVAFIDDETDREMAGTRVLEGDVLLNITGASLGRCCVAYLDGLRANVNQHVSIIRPRNGGVESRFLAYEVMSPAGQCQIFETEMGISRDAVNFEQIGRLVLVLPDTAEQQAIAEFLDRETAKIDALVGKKERLIELLQEKRTALITHAVTKGLDPDAAMKDSGIEWLGKIPAHWENPRIQDCVELAVGFAFPSDSFLHGESDEGVKLVRGDNVTTGALRWGEKTRRWPEVTPDLEHLLLKENDIVIGMDGSKVGRNYALVRADDLPLLLVQRVARLRPNRGVSSKYLFYSIANPRFHTHVDLEKSDPAIPHVSGWSIGHYRVFLPSLAEQQAIAVHIDRETAKIDALIAKVGEAIERLKEYRTALISAAVTGKIDVQEEVR